MTRYVLNSSYIQREQSFMVIGCGGTGSFVAEGLCRLLTSIPGAKIVLVDHDRVEERNLERQNFHHEELGMFKAEALALRLSRQFKRTIGYSLIRQTKASVSNTMPPSLIIGCVDNAAARDAIATSCTPSSWWVDAGNGEHWGQVLIGNASKNRELHGGFHPARGVVHALPLPTIQRPELLVEATVVDLNCAEGVQAGTQSPTINQFMAGVVLECVRRLLWNECSWMQVYLNLRELSMSAIEASPELVHKITGVPMKSLVLRERRSER